MKILIHSGTNRNIQKDKDQKSMSNHVDPANDMSSSDQPGLCHSESAQTFYVVS